MVLSCYQEDCLDKMVIFLIRDFLFSLFQVNLTVSHPIGDSVFQIFWTEYIGMNELLTSNIKLPDLHQFH